MLDRQYIRRGYKPEYTKILEELQKIQNASYWEMNQLENIDSEQRRNQMTPFVRKFLKDRFFAVDGYTDDELATKLVNDIEFYSVLTYPLEDAEVEGININLFEDIRVTFRNGNQCKIDGFQNAQHGIDIMKRLLLESNVTLDEATPIAEASIGSKIRIEVLQYPLVDRQVGICGYIRKLSQKIYTTEEYLQGDFASADELKTMGIALKRGVSMLIVGKVNTGKTTFLSYLMSRLPRELQLVTIENGAREIDLVKHGKDGNTETNVVHLLTRHSTIPEQNVTQEKLIEAVLRLNADVISVAEMRNSEAYAAQEASLVGTAVISTTHAGSPQLAHERIAQLCRKRYPIDMQTALMQARKAFPMIAFVHTPNDGRRRIINLAECYIKDDKSVYSKLYGYEFGKNNALGEHKKHNAVSENLIEHMKLYGLTSQEKLFLRGDGK